jgi:hypothetical protein
MNDVKLPDLAKEFFDAIDKKVGPFDRPFQFRPFPFDSGGALNFLTVGAGREKFVTYVSWDLFGQEKQKRGKMGRYELLTTCDNEQWCLDVVTNIGRQTLIDLFEPGDTMDITPWGSPFGLQGMIFEEGFSTKIEVGLERENCGLLRCIGITDPELDFTRRHGTQALIECLKRSGIYPNTVLHRPSINLAMP